MTRTVRGPHIFHWRKFLSIVLALGCLKAVAAENFLVEPIPAWTSPIDIDTNENVLEKTASQGVFFLLVDTEINGATSERYLRLAEKFLSSSGVEANSRLSFSFDPAYEKLVLHKIVIHRGDEVIDELDPAKIRVIQQEKDLDRLIYNGAQTAFLFLEDVRVGDWVEYAYTIRGRNPLEHGHFYDALQLRWPFPVQAENYRLLWPRAYQPLWVQAVGKVPQNRKVVGDHYEYSWHWENRPGQEVEDLVPMSVFFYAMVHFTDYRTWKDVANWANESFNAAPPSAELQDKIQSFKSADMTDEERVVKALEFVQDDIRYLGIENGINSHKPTDPSVVLTRGYGDCKDKALLFCTILHSLGIPAAPVLVSTKLRARIKDLLPTPWTFNHVIVQVVVQDKTNYVDVTRTFQRGPLTRRFVDDFGAGVLLAAESPGLIVIPHTFAGTPRTIIDEYFNIPTNAPSRLTIQKVFEGSDADYLRQQLATISHDALEKNVVAYYRKFYPDLGLSGHFETQDTTELDRIRLTEHFVVTNIWKPSRQTNHIACEFYADGMMDRLYVPEKKVREYPLAVPFPENYVHRIEIDTPEPWRITPEEKKIQNRAFRFYHHTTYTNNRVVLVNELMTLSPGVNATNLPEYLDAVNQLPPLLSLVIGKPLPGTGTLQPQAGSSNWILWMAVVPYAILLAALCFAVSRYRFTSPPLVVTADPALQGIDGWLVLLAIGLVLGVLVRLAVFIRSGVVYSGANWQAISDPASATYNAMTAPVVLFGLLANVSLFIFLIFLTFLFFGKKRLFPNLFIAYLIIQFFAGAVVVGLTANLKRDSTYEAAAVAGVLIELLQLLIWGLYTSFSRRVKLTFVN